MTYNNDVRDYIAALESKATTSMSDLFKHFHAMSYQIAALRDAFAMAQALNRTLVRLLSSLRLFAMTFGWQLLSREPAATSGAGDTQACVLL